MPRFREMTVMWSGIAANPTVDLQLKMFENNSFVPACIDAGCVLDPGFGECYPPAWNTSSSIHVRISHSAGGPWVNSTEVNIQGMSNILKIAAEAADNPSPLVIPNASSPSGYTILMAFRFPGGDSWCGKPRCAPSVIGLAKAEVRAMPPRLHECDLLSR